MLGTSRGTIWDRELAAAVDAKLAAGELIGRDVQRQLDERWLAVMPCERCSRLFCTPVNMWGAVDDWCGQCRAN